MRRWICALAALAVTILVVAGCTVDGQPTASRSEGGPTASVTDSGLSYSSDDVAIHRGRRGGTVWHHGLG